MLYFQHVRFPYIFIVHVLVVTSLSLQYRQSGQWLGMLRAGDGQDPRWSYDAIDGWEELRTQFGCLVSVMYFCSLRCCFQHVLSCFGQMDRCSFFMLFLHSSVHSSAFVDLVLPGVEVLCFDFPFLCLLECFRVSMGDILSALCNIKMYRTPIQTVSYDTVKYRTPSCEVAYDTVKYHTPLERSVVRYCKVSHALREKLHTIL